MTTATETILENNLVKARPFLKWAGGKTQLLPALLPLVPHTYGKYIEPFVGAGAFFFALGHHPSIISDSNDELIVAYTAVRDNVDGVIATLNTFKNTKDAFYEIRAWEPLKLTTVMRAARLIYLNKTCFNGLFRVNKHGQFNTPYNGKEGANFIQLDILRQAHTALQNVKILPGDYQQVLREHAIAGDFVFLDPPYAPVGKYSDFKRYTKDQFHNNDQVALATEFERLVSIGCKVILTNSAHESILELYKGYNSKVIDSKRLISSDVRTRKGTDLIVLGGF